MEDAHISADHHHGHHELEESSPSVPISVSGVESSQAEHSHDVQLSTQGHPSSGIADPVCLAPGLPGVDTTNYQFRFVFENDEAEKDSGAEGNPAEHSDTIELAPESQNEKSQDHPAESRNEQHSSQSFDQPQKAPNMPYPQHSQFENMEEPPMSQQIFFGYQQIPPVYLQQPSHLQNRADPSLKVHNELSPAVLPHILAPPNPFFSGLYPGSHHLLGDQQFPFNPLPSDPAMNDMRMARMYGMDPLGYPLGYPQQHQGPHGQHAPEPQPNMRNSPPINGPSNQFGSGNGNGNGNAGADSSKFPQSQQHEISGMHGSGPLHDIQVHQPNPQLSHQHHQPFPYYYQPFIPGQFPIHMPMRGAPYYGTHKGHPGHPPSAFPQVIDMHNPHGPHQPSFFPQEMKGQKPQHIYGHPSDGQEGFEKSQSQSSSQQPQQQQSHLQGDLHKGQGFGYNFPHSYQGQPQN
jgi:hypothetical protein